MKLKIAAFTLTLIIGVWSVPGVKIEVYFEEREAWCGRRVE